MLESTGLAPDAPFVVRDRDDAAIRADLKRFGIALSVAEVRRIADGLQRDPTIVEAYAFDAQWSEHCSYKSSRHYLRNLPTTGPTVLQGPAEDAGVVRLGEHAGDVYGIVIAHESHNHPSQVVPFEGAATGIGGIVRDVLCMGARVIAVADPLRFGSLDDPHARYVAQGVVDGIAAYGNAIGVPNIAGDVYFDADFDDNCLVNVVALGLVKADEIIHSCAPPNAEGFDIVLVGKATDRSGFGGAAFSSLVLDEADAEANKGAVQVPDPFLKNVIMRASYKVFDVVRAEGIAVGYKDLGAGGIVGCTAELAASGNFGAIVDLDRCPTSQDDLPAAVIAIGETQERLAWIVPPSFTPRLLAIYNEEFSLPLVSRGACAAIIGTVVAKQHYVARFDDRTVMDVPLDFFTGGIRYDRAVEKTVGPADGTPPDAPIVAEDASRVLALLDRVLAHRDVCSRRPIFERFDSVVRGTTAIPAGFADAGVIVPILGAPLACALAVDGNPRYGKIDAERAAELAVIESIRNVACVGAAPVGLTDCLNFGNPENPVHFGAFASAIDGLARSARELAVPYVSGNVSLYNENTSGASVPPSPVIACVGAIADIARTATHAFKTPGAAVFRVGRAQSTFGGSVIADVLAIGGGALPAVDYPAIRAELALLHAAFAAGLVAAAHDISDGGMLAALAEMAFATYDADRVLGVHVALPAEAALAAAFFTEQCGTLVETTDEAAFVALAAQHGAAIERVAAVTDDALLRLGAEQAASVPIAALYETWSAPLRDFYEAVR